MKFMTLLFGLLGLVTMAAAWSKEDREIFRIRDELRAHMEDPDQSFYDLLGIKPSASIEDISKAFRKITRSLHPDKVAQKLKAERIAAKKAGTFIPGVNINKPPSQKEIRAAVKVAEERQSRLSLFRTILSGPERDRYDHFLRNGFPAWKGTNYYYDRYRPGLGTALFGRYIKFARDQAWGDNLDVPGIDYASPSPPPADDDEQQQATLPVNRRQRRFEEKAARKEKGTTKVKRSAGSGTATPRETQGDRPVGPRKRVIAENGKVLVVDHSGNVYLEEQDEEGNLEQFLLDPTELKEPTFFDTAVVRLPVWAFNSTVGRALGKKPAAEDLDLVDVDSDNDPVHDTPGTDSAAEDFELLDKSTDSLGKAKSSGAQAGAKVNRRKKSKR
ncbi:hypothetical protein VdG1_04739 [Verticillium dahliae VDG1]|nr:hypothetical protein VdG1_04739 [Verticillium dahliae VDG1]